MTDISFRLVKITPEKARQMLENNSGNRKLYQKTVDGYARDMIAGRWQLTHQCIAVDEFGNLIDGQHRLTAIVQSGVPVMMYLAKYMEKTTALNRMIDRSRPRNAVDILHCQSKTQESARCLLSVLTGWQVAPTIAEIQSVIEMHGELFDLTNNATRTATRNGRTSAAIRVAFAMQIHNTPTMSDELTEQLYAFAMLDFDAMWESLKALVKLFDKVNRPTQSWYLSRVFWALQPENRLKRACYIRAETIQEQLTKTAEIMTKGAR